MRVATFGCTAKYSHKAETMDIIFEPDAIRDIETGNLVFFCTADGEPVRCAITEDALKSFEAQPEEMSSPETFAKHRDRICAIASRLIQTDGWNDRAGVLITHSEIVEYNAS